MEIYGQFPSENSFGKEKDMDRYEEISENLKRVRNNIEEAKIKRTVKGDVNLLLATKTVPADEILYATDVLGCRLIGENKVMELCGKYDALAGHADMHLIGHLQTNKVKNIVGKVSLIESVDSFRLASEIDRISKKQGIVSDILVEINIGKEEAKGGVMPEETSAFFEEIAVLDSIRPVGIMTMAPNCEKKSDYHGYFAKTYEIFLDISQKYLYNIMNPVLSMGMTNSYEIAILEGATEVRVGSAVFGKRSYN